MAKILVSKPYAILTCNLSVVVINVDGEHINCKVLDILKMCKTKTKNEEGKCNVSVSESYIAASDISQCGSFFVICTSDKDVCLFDTNNWDVLSNRISHRVASKVRFLPSGRGFLLADKSGDAYSYSVENPQEEGIFLLGHLSMLLDIIVSIDEKLIVTCDRDEKIRVSKYPNAYNIQSYCLGHKEFVSGISILPHDNMVLVSSSGDGSVRFWDYIAGIELHAINYKTDVKIQTTDNCILPISVVSSSKKDTESSVIAVGLSTFHGCIIYEAKGDVKNIKTNLLQVINLQAEPWDILLSEKKIWIIGPFERECLSIYKWEDEKCNFINDSSSLTMLIAKEVSKNRSLFENLTCTTLLTLYKRKFDNLQEYHEKKKQRLAAETLKS